MRSDTAARQQLFEEVLAGYLEAQERGDAPAPQSLIARYPQLADELRSFFANQDMVRGLAGSVPHAMPARFGSYEILDELGRGGMGVVYRARQVGLNRIVALKVILDGDLATASGRERFRAEAAVVADLDHPHIVPVYEVGEIDGQCFFSMKLIEGPSLKDVLPEYRKDPRPVVRLMADVARAVHHAHQRGVLHRDLKPANILLRRKSEVPNPKSERNAARHSDLGFGIWDFGPMVADFGLAKRARADGKVSHSGTVVGTAGYMAPEQALGREALTTAADVYSLGAILYECLTGRPPFRAASYLDTLLLVVQQEPAPPHTLNPRVDPDLEKICLRCLKKEPYHRYGSALELAQELDAWLAGDPLLVRPPTRGERLRRWARKHPGVAFLSVVVLLLLLTLGVGAGWTHWQMTRLVEELETAREEADSDAHRSRVSEVDALDRSKAALKLVETADQALRKEKEARKAEAEQRERHQRLLVQHFVANAAESWQRGDLAGSLPWLTEALEIDRDRPEREAIQRMRLGLVQRRLPRLVALWSGEARLAEAILSPAGDVVLGRGTDAVYLWPLAGDGPRSSLPHTGRITSASFSGDGRLVVTTSEDRTACVWHSAAGKLVGKPLRHPQTVRLARFDREGKLVLTVSERTIQAWEETGNPTGKPMRAEADVVHACFSPDGRTVAAAEYDVEAKKGYVRLWDVTTGKAGAGALIVKHALVHLAFSTDGNRLVGIGSNQQLHLWDTVKVTSVRTPFPLRNDPAGAISPDLQRYLDVSGAEAHLNQFASDTVTAAFRHDGAVHLAQFSPNGNMVVTAGADLNVRVWDPTGQLVCPPLPHGRRVSAAMFDASGRFLLTRCDDRTVRLWDLARDEVQQRTLPRTAGTVQAVSPDNRFALVGSTGSLRLWDNLAGKPAGSAWKADEPTFVALGPEGRLAALPVKDGLRLVDATTGNVRALLPSQVKLSRAWFTEDGRHVVALTGENALRLWDVNGNALGVQRRLPRKAARPVLAVSPDARYLALPRESSGLEVFDVARKKMVGEAIPLAAPPTALAFSHDAERIAVASEDGGVRVWRVGRAEPVTLPLSHGASARALALSHDGQFLATLAGSSVRLWEVATSLPVGPPLPVKDAVQLAFSAEARRLLVSAGDGALAVWDIAPLVGKPAALAALGEVLSGQRLHAPSGSLVPIDSAELRRAWAEARKP